MQDAAARISAAILHSKMKRVVVFDFVGPGNNSVTLLGKNLADDFSKMLAVSSTKLKVEDRSQIGEVVNNEGYTQIALLYPGTAASIARDLKAQELIWGSLSSEAGGIKVRVSLDKASSDFKNMESAEMLLPLSDQRKELLSHVVVPDPLANYPIAGEGGYSDPRCVFCPSPPFTNEALQDRVEGTVVLWASVGLHGEIGKIVIVRGLPDGLTEQAIKAVRNWRLTPATGPDGKPAAVQTGIDVEFHLTP